MARFRRLLTIPIVLLSGFLLGCEDEDLPTAQRPSTNQGRPKKTLEAAASLHSERYGFYIARLLHPIEAIKLMTAIPI